MPVVSDEDWIYGNRKYNVTHSYLTKILPLLSLPLQPLIIKLFNVL